MYSTFAFVHVRALISMQKYINVLSLFYIIRMRSLKYICLIYFLRFYIFLLYIENDQKLFFIFAQTQKFMPYDYNIMNSYTPTNTNDTTD